MVAFSIETNSSRSIARGDLDGFEPSRVDVVCKAEELDAAEGWDCVLDLRGCLSCARQRDNMNGREGHPSFLTELGTILPR